jgi:transcriptional regulator with XRE-family HTH domain
MSNDITPLRRRNRIFPVTELRAERMRHGLPLHRVADRAGISTCRASVIERDSSAISDEIAALKAAITALASPESGRAV